MFNKISNQRGMSLVEVMVSGAMTIIISLGVATMMQNSFKEQRRVVLLDTLRNQKVRFETMIRDQAVWNATMQNNAIQPFIALKAGTAATQVPQATPVQFSIYNADNTLAYNLLGPASTTGSGFTEKGTVCSGFSTVAGTDTCPFSYRLLVAAVCASGSSCTNPQLKLVARLVFSPSPTGPMANLVNMISPIAGSSIADTVADGKYDAVVKRTATTVNRSFRIISGFTPGAAGCANGAGTCFQHVSNFLVHPLTAAGTTASGRWDDNNPVTNNGAFDDYDLVDPTIGSGNFRFKEGGYYGCLASVPAFATGGFGAQLYDATSGTVIATASVTAGQWVQATTIIDAKFNVADTSHNYQIRQRCDTNPGGTPNANNCTLGFGTNPYTGFTVFVTLSCYKIDRAM